MKKVKRKTKQIRVYLHESYADVLDMVKEFTGKTSDSDAVNVIIADLIARGLNINSLRREYEKVENEIIVNYKKSLQKKSIEDFQIAEKEYHDDVLDNRYHPEASDGMDYIYLNPAPADWFKVNHIKTNQWGERIFGSYSLERQYVRDARFVKPPADGGHNPFHPNPDRVIHEAGGAEVWRVRRNGQWTYFLRLSNGCYFCDWNGYRMGDYMDCGIEYETEGEKYPHVFANLLRGAVDQLRADIRDAEQKNDPSLLQPVVTPDYRYYDSTDALSFLT